MKLKRKRSDNINLSEQIKTYADLSYKSQFENMDTKLKDMVLDFKRQVVEKFKVESDIKRFLDNIHIFNQYSYNNQMLIFLQNEKATYVASIQSYNKMGYKVNKGETGIKILIPRFYTTVKIKNADGTTIIKPFNQLSESEKKRYYNPNDFSVVFYRNRLSYFGVGNVYDISQTNMPFEVIEQELNPVLEDERANDFINDFIMAIYRDGFKVQYADIASGAKGYCSHKEKLIVLKNGLGSLMKLKVLIHEYAHALAHQHLENNHREYEAHRNQYEVEAETIAYVVSRYFGLDTGFYSLNYIYAWSKTKDIEEVDNSLQMIVNNSKRIIDNFKKIQGAQSLCDCDTKDINNDVGVAYTLVKKLR